MDIITQKNKNTKRYLPHELKTREYAVKMYRNCGDVGFVCRKYHISRVSLWRWNRRNLHITLNEIWYKLKINTGYTRKPASLYRILRKNECKTKDLPKDKRFYQYTCIDEATRERYLYWYEEHSGAEY